MTIYALSSGPGVSGVAIIRISGSEASKVIKTLTGKEITKPMRKMGHITITGASLNEVKRTAEAIKGVVKIIA